MPLIEVLLTLEFDESRCSPQVRAWLDLQPERDLRSEVGLPLERVRDHEWRGAFTIGDREPGHFLYRIGLAAHEGAHWTLELRHHARGRCLPILTDSDSFALRKQWLVGSCALPHPIPSTRLPNDQPRSLNAAGGAGQAVTNIVPLRPLV